MITSVKMTILCEDQARMGFLDQKFTGQHGLSIFVEAGVNVLFDVGPSAVTLDNARVAGIDLGLTDWIVLSHGHWDHADGMSALAGAGIRPRLLAHPGVFVDRRRSSGEFNGMRMSREQAAAAFELIETTEPYRIAEDVWFLGEVPRSNDFEAKQTSFHYLKDGIRHPDFLPDDTGLAIRTEKGLAVVAGCSHAGICNICEYAKQVAGSDRLHLVLGGFHLLDDSDTVKRTVDYFRQEQVERLYPMHCTGLPALARFRSAFGIEKLCTGDVVHIE